MTRFKGKPAIDPTTNQLVKDGSGQVFAVTDTAFASPLEVTDTAGLPLATISTGPLGIHQDFDTVDQHLEVVWKSGPYTVTLESSEGIAAAAAASAAQPAADAAAAATADALSSTFATKDELAAVGGGGGSGTQQFSVNVADVATSVTVPVTHTAHRLTMTADTTFTFDAPTEDGHSFLLYLSGAFVATMPESVVWDGGVAPAYDSTGTLYRFTTFDAGATWFGSLAGTFEIPTPPPPPGDTITKDFAGTDGTALTEHDPSWTVHNGTFTLTGGKLTSPRVDGALATFDVGTATTAHTLSVESAIPDVGLAPALVFRFEDTSNFFYLVPGVGGSSRFALWRVTAGVHRRLFTARDKLPAAGATYALRVDLNGNDITVWVDGVEIGTIGSTQGVTATRVGVRLSNLGTNTGDPTWDNLVVQPSLSTPPASPDFMSLATRTATPDLTLGAAGEWDDKDVNNPNVVWDAPNNRWVMAYSGYGNDDQIQFFGIATAPSLDGPWTKDPLNPVHVDPAVGTYGENGGLAKVGSTWVRSYQETQAGPIAFATSTDLHTWTRVGSIQGADSFLRAREDGVTLEVYDRNSGGMRRRTSTDLGATWSAGEMILVDSGPIGENDGGQPSVYIPPGKEGVQMLVGMDFRGISNANQTNGRANMLALTLDGGATWRWRVSNLPTADWDAGAVFDSHPVYDGAGNAYLYYAGTPITDTLMLDMSIQIGHKKVAWNPSVLG